MRKIAGLGAILPTLTLSIALHQTSPAQTPPAAETTYVKAGHLFDSESGTYRQNVTLVLDGDRIKSIESGTFAIPSGAKVVDLSNDYVLPGLIDCHTHLGARADKYDPINSFKETPFSAAYASVVNAQRTLNAGFTSVRDVGSLPFMAVDLRNAIDEGLFPGPRIVASGPPLSITGGHGDLNNYSPADPRHHVPRRA